MKLFIVAAVLGACSAARLDNAYLPPRGNSGSGSNAGLASPGFGGGFGTQHSGNAYNAPAQTYNAPSNFNGGFGGANAYSGAGAQNSRPQDANAQILRLNSDVKEDSFSYDFETSNGIRADASGVATNGVQSHGSFGYKGDDGQDYSITYTADENGYQPQGAHLPTPPPIPEEILKSLEQNARDEAAGIVDDGQYRGEGAGGHSGSQGYSGGNQGYSGNQGFSGNQGYSGNQGFSGNQGSGFQKSQGFSGNQGSGFQKSQGFGGAPSRQYLSPNNGPARGSGNGNFNQKSGYQY